MSMFESNLAYQAHRKKERFRRALERIAEGCSGQANDLAVEALGYCPRCFFGSCSRALCSQCVRRARNLCFGRDRAEGDQE